MSTRTTMLLLAALTLMLAACDGSPTGSGGQSKPAKVQINGPTELRVGETGSLSANVLDKDGQTLSTTVNWSSSDTTRAKIGGTGEVLARGVGEVTLTARAGEASGTHHLHIGSAPQIMLEEDTLRLTTLGLAVVVKGMREGAPVRITLSILNEHRWNAELAVAKVEGDLVTARGAGSVRLLASPAEGIGTPDTLTVIVTPERPYVASVNANDPVDLAHPLTVHGYRLGELPLGAITAMGDTARTVEILDSATVRVTLPAIQPTHCLPSTAKLALTGADDQSAGMTFKRARHGEIRLAVGDTARLSGPNVCLPIGGPEEAEYALAFYDARYAYWKGPGPLPYYKQDSFTVTVADLPGTGAPSAVSARWNTTKPAARSAHISEAPVANQSVEPGTEWESRTTPFKAGDVLDFQDMYLGRYEAVVLIATDYLVLAAPRDTAHVFPKAYLDSIAVHLDLLNQHFVPRLTKLFGQRPQAANGQYLLIGMPHANRETSAGSAGRRYSLLHLGVKSASRAELQGIHLLLAHELTHSFHNEFEWAQSSQNPYYPYHEQWDNEGLADFVAYRELGARYNLPFDANLPTMDLERLGYLISGSDGIIEQGYGSTAGLLFDLAWRLAKKTGMPWDQAHDAITLGLANNRYGCADNGCAEYEGLYDVMGRLMGPGWNPVDAVLTYALSVAADDRLPSEVFRVPMALNTYNLQGAWAFGPHANVVAGSGESQSSDPLKTGSTGWLALRGGGGAFQVSSTAPQTHWALIRLK